MRANRGAGVRPLVRLVVAGFAGLGWLNAAQAQFPSTSFNVKEIGTGLNPPIELEIPFSSLANLKSLTSPSGEAFNSSLSKAFPTLDAAFGYLAGTWQGTFVPRFPFGSAEQTFEFEVALVSPAAVYRGLPLNVSMHDGDQIQNGQTFLMSWDYESEEPIHGTSLQVVAKINSFTFSSLTVLSTPRPTSHSSVSGSSSVGSGSASAGFSRRYESEPGASENRFLTTYTASGSGSPLPADIALTIGAFTNLNSAITNDEDGDSNSFNNPPVIGLRYFRTDDPINFQIVAVPEPTSWALIAVVAMSAIGRLRLRTTQVRGGVI